MIDIKDKPDYFSLSEILADAELCAEIEQWSSPSFVKQGEILFQQGEDSGYAFFVKTGEIGLTMHVSGDAVWGVRARKGSLVGLPAIVGNEPYSMTARVLRDSEICKISRDDFHHYHWSRLRMAEEFDSQASLGRQIAGR
jgi:CRP-like cAMP-binding protein